MYGVMSRPGPVEAAILSELAPTFAVRRVPVAHITLRCLEGGPSAGSDGSSGDRPPLVLLHGRGHAATTWFPLLPELARRSRVIAVDLPGFGHSSSTPFTSGGPEEAMRFFVDPVEALVDHLGLRDPVLIGHSLGGLVAVEIALRGFLMPRALVLIGSMGLDPSMSYVSRAFFRAGPERVARLLGKSVLGRIVPYPRTRLGERLTALEYELYAVPRGRHHPAAAFNALFPAIGPAFHRGDRLAEIPCPVLLLWGGNDEVFPPSVAGAAASAMRDATVRIEPLGHSPHLEAPERALLAIADFLG